MWIPPSELPAPKGAAPHPVGATVLTAAPAAAVEGRAEEANATRVLRWTRVGFLCLPAAWAAVYFLPPLNHDVAAIYHFTERWLGGERLYVDLIDVNPPLIFFLALVPAFIAKALGIGGHAAVVGSVLALVFWAFRQCLMLIETLYADDQRAARLLFPPLILFAMVVNAGGMFGQREHLMTVVALPYLLLAAARLARAPVAGHRRIAIAVAATLGFAIKPYFLAVPLLVESYLLARRGFSSTVRDPVPWTMAATFAVVVLLAVLVTPEYATRVIPLARDTYLALGQQGLLSMLVWSNLTPTFLLFLVVLPFAFWLARSPLARVLVFATIAGVLIAAVQGKGWPYQLLPAESLAILLVGSILADGLDRHLPARGERSAMALAIAAATFLVMIYYPTGFTRRAFWQQAEFEGSQAGRLSMLLKQKARGDYVFLLSPGLYPHFPALNYADAKLGMRFMNTWLIQAAYNRCLPGGRVYREPSEMGSTEAYAFRAFTEDFVRLRPKVVVHDMNPGIPWCGKEFNYVEYFVQSPEFAAAWKDYEFWTAYDRYRLYVRKTH